MDRAVAIETTVSGRERELCSLLGQYDEARDRGVARFAFVHGPAGVGKTYLFSALRRSLTTRGVRVFEGRCSRNTPRAHALFADLVPELLSHLAEAGIPQRTVADLARRLGPLCGRGSGEGLAPEERRLDLCDAVAEVFSLASVGAPAFLFSDADAADRASLELLRYLAAAALSPGSRSGGLFVVSFRDDVALPSPLAELVSRTPGLGLPLTGLDLEGIRAFLSRKEIAERLLEATGGLPTALEDVVAAPAARPADLFRRRLAALDALDRDALLSLAVLGQPAGPELVGALLARLRGAAPSDLTARLDRLCRERFADSRPAVGESSYSVSRESARQTILSCAEAPDVAAARLAAGEELLSRGADPEAVARLFLAVDPTGRGAREALRAAETLSARCAFDEAADLFRRALEGLPPAERPAVHARLAQVLRASGDFTGALRHLGLARKGADAERVRALRAEAARLTVLMGRLSSAERLCRRVLADGAAPSPKDEAGVSAFAVFADVLFLQGRYAEAKAQVEQGLARLSARPELALALRNTLGKVLLTQGAYEEASAAFQANAELARETGNGREEARALINQGVVGHRRGDRRAAIGHYRAGLALCGSDRGLAALALSNLGSLFADSAEFEPAVEHLTRALSALTRARRSKEVAHAALNLARLHLFLGESDRAQELCDHAAAVSGEVGDPYLSASARLVRGEILEARVSLAEAISELAGAQAAFESLASPRYAAEAALALARAHLAKGDRTLARHALSAAALDEQAATSPSLAAERDLVAGELALCCGDLSEAGKRLSRAKEILLESPDLEGPYRVYHLLSRLKAAAGDASGAAADAARAARLLDELAGRVPAACRPAFLRHARRAAVLAAAAEREITPTHVSRALSLDPASEPAPHALIGGAPSLRKVLKVLDAVARSPATVLIRGESGTGKELLAEAIHRRSARREMPLVKVNCAAMVEDLLLSELFGHEKGAFTGAVRERKGRFELAEGGTIFLDEIGDVSPKAQVALLRVLQEREYERVGGTRTLKADVRVICATNRDLEGMIARGAFRQDLYYRLKGVMLELPALRERLDDLPVLCDHLLQRFARERHEEKKSLSPEAFEILRAYRWPGNVRELENVLSSASIFAGGRLITPEAFENIQELAPMVEAKRSAPEAQELEEDDEESGPRSLPPAPAEGQGLDYYALAQQRGLGLKDLRDELEAQCITRALEEARGNISEAARLLKMKRSRLSQIVNADPRFRAVAKG